VLRRLYESIARGLLDEELVEEVGLTLLLRCRAILTVSEARRGRVRCPVCDRNGHERYVLRGNTRGQIIRCEHCGWEIDWPDYVGTYQRRQLNEGGAGTAFRRFLETYPAAKSPWQKMLAIDLLIHEFHYSLRNQPDKPTRAACVNLIEGKLRDVVPFLNDLSGNTGGQSELRANHQTWQHNCAAAGEWHPK
jgi:ribosomal protein L37AE/L43A